jgi:hypothetical protein
MLLEQVSENPVGQVLKIPAALVRDSYIARLDLLLVRALEELRPPPVESLSQWIERVVRLPRGLAAEPVPVKLYPESDSGQQVSV